MGKGFCKTTRGFPFCPHFSPCIHSVGKVQYLKYMNDEFNCISHFCPEAAHLILQHWVCSRIPVPRGGAWVITWPHSDRAELCGAGSGSHAEHTNTHQHTLTSSNSQWALSSQSLLSHFLSCCNCFPFISRNSWDSHQEASSDQ